MVRLPHGRLDGTARLAAPVTADERSRGASGEDALTLVKYADFECPMCRAFHERWWEMGEEVRERVRFVHRHFPMTGSHPMALRAAMGAEAAGAQGRFWPMYDLLFRKQESREPGWLEAYAEELGLDMERFRREVDSRSHAPRVWAHVRSGRRSGVKDTPGLFLGGLTYEPPPDDPDELAEDLRAALAALEGEPGG